MKNIASLIVSVFAITVNVIAQPMVEPAPAPTPQTFLDEVGRFFTSFRPELEGTFTNRGDFYGGPVFRDGHHYATQLGGGYRVWNGIGIEGRIELADVTGVTSTTLGGLSYNIKVHDVLVKPYALAGYDLENSTAMGEVGIFFAKALTQNTFSYLQLGCGIEKQPKLSIGAGVGFNF